MPDVVVSSKVLSTLDEAPGQGGAAITPHNTNDIGPFRSLWVGGAGAISMIFVNDSTPTLISGIPAGTLLPFAVKRVRITDTDATLIVGIR